MTLTVFCSSNLFAQVDSPFLSDELLNSSIVVKEKSIIYLPNPYNILEINSALDNKLNTNLIANLDNAKQIKIKKQIQLPLIGFIRRGKEFKYSMYIVEYNGKRCLVSSEDVLDNSLLEKKNQSMQKYYECLLDSLSIKQAEYDSLLAYKKREIETALIKNQEERNQTDSLVAALYHDKVSERLEPLQKDFSIWYEQLPASSKKAAKVLTIQRSALYPPNSVGGCDYRLRFTNMSTKTIKYLYWYGNVYNAVNDKVACTVRRTYNFTGQCTGPINAHQIDDGDWETVIYNWSAKEMRLTKVTVIYMDGSSSSISGSDIINISNAPECFLSESNLETLHKDAVSEIENAFKNNEAIWTDRKKYIDYDGNLGKTIAKRETHDYLHDLSQLRFDIQKITRKINFFESQNNLSVN